MHSCRKYYLILGCFIILCSAIRAQDTLSTAGVEAQSYSLYSQKNWDELIRYGNMALSKGFDYYYLRYRLGVAYFEKKKYRIATTQFEKANKFNSTDETLEYLYYCYNYTGQYERARWISKSFSPDAIAYTGSDKLKAFSFATLEGGIRTSNIPSKFQTTYYGQMGLGHFVGNRISLFHAITYLNQTDFRSNNNQFQYYLGASVPLKHDWKLSLGIQPIFISTNPFIDSVRIHRRPKMVNQPPPRDTTIAIDSTGPTVTSLNMVLAFSVSKSFSRFELSLGSAVGLFNNFTQFQHSFSFNYYPFGNSKLLFGLDAFMHTENNYQRTHDAILPSVYAEPFKSVSLTVSYLANNSVPLIENNGYIVNDNPDFMVARFSILADFKLSSCITAYCAYQNQDNIEVQFHGPFQYNLFITGIKYIPK